MQHVRVGDHHMPGLADGLARGGGRVPVVGEGLDVHIHLGDQLIQLRHLVLGEGLGGKEVKGAGIVIF